MLLKGARKLGKNLTKSSCIDLSSWEKRTALLTGVWFEVKNILSLLAGKICSVFWTDLALQKNEYVLNFYQNPFESAEFFSRSATSPRQKIVKEIAYKMTYTVGTNGMAYIIRCTYNKHKLIQQWCSLLIVTIIYKTIKYLILQ